MGRAGREGTSAYFSLEHKLPLLAGVLLLAVAIALSTAGYIETRRTTIAAASARLEGVTSQFRDLLAQSGAQLRAAAASVAGKPELAAFIEHPDAASREKALAILQPAPSQAAQFVAAELRDSTNRVVLSSNPEAGTDTISATQSTAAAHLGDSATIGRFHVLRDTVVYPVAAGVRGATGTYAIIWHKLAASRRGREDLSRLIGSRATLRVGNTDGSQWSDLDRPTSPPTGIAHLAAIPGTPWTVAVAFPRDVVMAPVQQFLWTIALIAVLALAGAVAIAWFASRRITVPLRTLTQAARNVASGDLASVPRIARSDELGQLGEAFSTMAAEISESRTGLEAKVEERTRDLNQALDQLHDAQDSLVRREKLAMLGQLAGGVGHELRNPLGVMTNAVYYLKMCLRDQPATVGEYLDILQQQITLSEKIVGDLLDFARSKPPQRAFTSLAEVTTAQISRLGATNGVRIDTQIADVPPVLVDQTQIGQIILNLLTNAMHAVDGEGTITVRVGTDGAHARVDVADTGKGIDPAHMEKIFEPLFTTKARGIGLGLAVSRTLARANDGELTASSPPGEGATFCLTLPRRANGAGK